MGGIFGILASNCSISKTALEHATDSLAHRGPDDKGTVVIQGGTSPSLEIGLGSRRLAILDLSSLGHQPMKDAETGNWIVYNGEIYNFRELRQRLQGEGVRFFSQSDTEVLLKAYGRWGERCLGNCVECSLLPYGMRSDLACCWAAIPWASSRCIIVPRVSISSLLLNCARCSVQR